MTLCASCFMVGYCKRLHASVVTDDELQNIDFVNDLLDYAQKLRLKPSGWRSYLTEAYTDYQGRILDAHGEEEFLNMGLFEVDDTILFATNDVAHAAKQVTIANHAIRDWFDYWLCNPPVPRKHVNFSAYTRERLRVVGTILRAVAPEEAQFWGLKGKAANDNEPT